MHMSKNGQELLARWEGVELKIYQDVAGLSTIGVGHLLTQDELSSGKIFIQGMPVRYGGGLTRKQVMDLLAQDLHRFEKIVNEQVKVALKPNQFDALVSFVFNVGRGAFQNSTLLKVLNQGNYGEVPKQLARWIFSGGKKIQGLINRRNKEIDLWNS